MSHPVDILEVSEGLSKDEAKHIEDMWLAKTGRRCIVLSGGHFAGTIVVEAERNE